MVWNSLEIAKLVVGVTTPISVGCLGWFVSRRLKQLEDIQWKNRKVIERRIDIFDRLAPLANRLYCYFLWIGPWKEMSPPEAIALKRKLDHEFHVNRYIVGEPAFAAYAAFMEPLFDVFTGRGSDAALKTAIAGEHGDRRTHSKEWRDEWSGCFSQQPSDLRLIRERYIRLMQALQESIGLTADD